jgi:P27 family predicted phage terminase small subunit
MNLHQPKPPKAYPEMPKNLSPVAKKAWQQVCDTLYKIGVLTNADGYVVEALCEAYAELCAARAALKVHGALTYESKTASGDPIWKPYPEMAIINDADRRFRMWLSAVGLTPSDRSRVVATPNSVEEDISEFLQ